MKAMKAVKDCNVYFTDGLDPALSLLAVCTLLAYYSTRCRVALSVMMQRCCVLPTFMDFFFQGAIALEYVDNHIYYNRLQTSKLKLMPLCNLSTRL